MRVATMMARNVDAYGPEATLFNTPAAATQLSHCCHSGDLQHFVGLVVGPQPPLTNNSANLRPCFSYSFKAIDVCRSP